MKTYSKLALFLALTAQSIAAQTFYSTSGAPLGGVGLIWNGTDATTQQAAPTASTTIEFDLTLQQIRVFGFVPETLYTMTSSAHFEEQVLVGYTTPGFPNPPIPIPIYENRVSDMTASLTVTIPSYSFDTGLQSFSWDGSNYSFTSNINLNTVASIDAYYSITADGTSYIGNQSFDITIGISSSTPQTWAIEGSEYPANLGAKTNWKPFGYSDVQVLANFTASNGTPQSLIVIPEPSSLAISLLASTLLLTRRKRQMHAAK